MVQKRGNIPWMAVLWKCLVDFRGRRGTGRLLRGKRKAPDTTKVCIGAYLNVQDVKLGWATAAEDHKAQIISQWFLEHAYGKSAPTRWCYQYGPKSLETFSSTLLNLSYKELKVQCVKSQPHSVFLPFTIQVHSVLTLLVAISETFLKVDLTSLETWAWNYRL